MEPRGVASRAMEWRSVQPFARRITAHQQAFDVLLAVVFTTFCLVVNRAIAQDSSEPYNAWAVATVLVVGATLAFRRTAPELGLAVQTVALAYYSWKEYAGGPVYLAPMVNLYTIAAEGDRRRTWISVGAVMSAFLVVFVVTGAPASHLAYLITFSGWAAGAVFLGRATANRRQYLGELEQRARDLEDSREEETRRRVAEERLRIARDLHDAVAHGIATIHLRAGAALHVLDRNPEEAERALTAIKQVSKETLAELRSTLGMLRQPGDDDVPLGPIPSLVHLDHLLDATRHAGVAVELEMACDPASLPLTVDVAAYRIVQESLTNVMRHAGDGARARIVVRLDDGAVDVEVTDDGRGPAVGTAAQPAGHGIEGMRERATTVGGTLTTGRRPGGGFRVHARLPVPLADSSPAATESLGGVAPTTAPSLR
jgi:signal transduction histidine kinase